MILGDNRIKVIENIKNAVANEDYNVKVEEDDPNLSDEEKRKILNKYLKKQKRIGYKINNKIAKTILTAVTWMENKDIEVVGLENIKDIKTGAIITSNHFNQLDNIIIRRFVKKAGKKKFYIIAQDTNLAMGKFLGYMINHAGIIPISNQVGYMKDDFQKTIKKVLDKKNYILIYPEQEMWFNYRKPRTLKPGAYFYASKYKVPVISCFVEMIDKEENDTEEFKKVQYKIHVLNPIYPDKDKTDKENAAWMLERDYEQKKEAYEKAYNKELDYKFENEDIAGWIVNE